MKYYIITILKKKFRAFSSVFIKVRNIDFTVNFQILFGQWEGVILEIQYRLLRIVCLFLPLKNHTGVVIFSYLNIAPLNLYPINRWSPVSVKHLDDNDDES